MAFPARLLPALSVALIVGAAGTAHAELVHLTSGRVISAARVVFGEDSATITLRGGGEVTCSRALIVRVDPDEVPWVDPSPAPAEQPSGSSSDAATAPAAAPVPEVVIPDAYRALVTGAADRHGVDARLVHAVISVESAYRPRARSRKGARGLMQLMPATARQYGVRNAYQAAANVDAGVRHLRSLLDRFAVREALAAYNAGEAAVRRFGGVPPFRETRAYVDRVLSLAGFETGAAPAAPGRSGS
jgi:hypothetical protein